MEAAKKAKAKAKKTKGKADDEPIEEEFKEHIQKEEVYDLFVPASF